MNEKLEQYEEQFLEIGKKYKKEYKECEKYKRKYDKAISEQILSHEAQTQTYEVSEKIAHSSDALVLKKMLTNPLKAMNQISVESQTEKFGSQMLNKTSNDLMSCSYPSDKP